MPAPSLSPAAPSTVVIYGALVVIQILFGLNYVVSKDVVASFPPIVWASIRIAISAVIMVTVAILSGKKHPKPSFEFFGPLILFSLFGFVINQSCFLVGLQYTTATNSAVLNTLIPVFTLLIVTLKGSEKLTPKKLLGFGFAFAGVLVVRPISEFSFSDATAIGDFLTIANCLSFAIFLSTSKSFIEKYDRVWTTAWFFICGTVGIGALSLNSWSTFVMPEMTNELWACASYAVIGGTLLTYFLNGWTLAHTRSSNVALFIYIQPVIAAGLNWGWKGVPITHRTIVSTILIFSGMLLSIRDRK